MSENSSSGGMSLGGVLAVVFVALKLLEIHPVVAWSWWWVFSPVLIGTGIGVFLFFIAHLLTADPYK